jgi:hypothetical protein
VDDSDIPGSKVAEEMDEEAYQQYQVETLRSLIYYYRQREAAQEPGVDSSNQEEIALATMMAASTARDVSPLERRITGRGNHQGRQQQQQQQLPPWPQRNGSQSASLEHSPNVLFHVDMLSVASAPTLLGGTHDSPEQEGVSLPLERSLFSNHPRPSFVTSITG